MKIQLSANKRTKKGDLCKYLKVITKKNQQTKTKEQCDVKSCLWEK